MRSPSTASRSTGGPTRRARAGLGRSFQSLELFEDVTVRENLLVACDDHDPARYGLDLVHPGRPVLSPVAAAAVREFGLERDLDALPDSLPHGRRRLVAIARAVAASPSVLLLDEPAAGLAAIETEELGRLVRWLAHDVGLAVLMIEHDVGLVLSVCDRVAVLDFGDRHRPRIAVGDRRGAGRHRRLSRGAGLMLDIRGLTAGYGDVPVVHGIDLTVGAGEVVALLGPNGAGKTTTLLALGGVLPSTGEVRYDDGPLTGPLHRRARRGLGLITEERAVFRQLSTRTNLALGAGGVDGALGSSPSSIDSSTGRRACCRAASSRWWSSPGPWRPGLGSCWSTSCPSGWRR